MPCSKGKHKVKSKEQARALFAAAGRGEISEEKVREMVRRSGGMKNLPEKSSMLKRAVASRLLLSVVDELSPVLFSVWLTNRPS